MNTLNKANLIKLTENAFSAILIEISNAWIIANASSVDKSLKTV